MKIRSASSPQPTAAGSHNRSGLASEHSCASDRNAPLPVNIPCGSATANHFSDLLPALSRIRTPFSNRRDPWKHIPTVSLEQKDTAGQFFFKIFGNDRETAGDIERQPTFLGRNARASVNSFGFPERSRKAAFPGSSRRDAKVVLAAELPIAGVGRIRPDRAEWKPNS
jgi:hypothetical protein